ncbi:MAG: hypothetical protein IPL75_07175 [Acidobacteria bacterium]|nr:hypothetical protein [Acidobacteriota bacterium]
MQSQKFVVTSVLAAVLLFTIGGLVYGSVLANFFAANMGSATGITKEPADFWAIVVGELAGGTLLTLVIAGWARVGTAAGGAKVGAVMALMMTINFDFVLYGTSNVANLTAACVDVLVNTVRYAIVGAFVGWMTGRGR